jgi:hypothetical protein
MMKRRLLVVFLLAVALFISAAGAEQMHDGADDGVKCEKVYEKPNSCDFARAHCDKYDGVSHSSLLPLWLQVELPPLMMRKIEFNMKMSI